MQILFQGFRVKVLVITINVNGFISVFVLVLVLLGLGLDFGLGHPAMTAESILSKSIKDIYKMPSFPFRWLAQTQHMRH